MLLLVFLLFLVPVLRLLFDHGSRTMMLLLVLLQWGCLLLCVTLAYMPKHRKCAIAAVAAVASAGAAGVAASCNE